ncbi:MAG: hypothetical protein AAGL90_04345 [Pseudomonadota bacterium]
MYCTVKICVHFAFISTTTLSILLIAAAQDDADEEAEQREDVLTVTDGLVIEGPWQRFADAAIEPNNGQGLIGVDNVFDEAYECVFEGVAEPGANFKIAASWQFGA